MKEKVKIFIFNMMICYSIFIVIFIVYNMFGITNKIELKDKEENLVKINNIKKYVSKQEDNACRSVINDMILAYENTSFDGTVKTREFYDKYMYDVTLMAYYNDFVNKCNVTSNEMKEMDMPNKFLSTSFLFFEDLYQSHMFEYELKIEDKYFRLIGESETSNLKYQLTKEAEIDIIETLIKRVYGGDISE